MSDFIYGGKKVTDIQIKFLECIYKEELTAKELCKKLKIKVDKTDNIGGCYNKLNHTINFLTSDEGNEIDDMFTISHVKEPVPNNDTYIITKKGMKYIEDYWRENRTNISSKIISIIALFISIISIIITVVLHFL